ncbi:MAG: carbon-nitrogen hydrolase family protein [Bacteroidota bacterium]
MRICLAQSEAIKGDIRANIQNHLGLIKRAAERRANVVVFPELSITGYEPTLANALATYPEDPILRPFQAISDQHQITIGAGMPTKADTGLHISMLIFQPHQAKPLVYTKRLLHADERPYFKSGNNQPSLVIGSCTIAFGICYESLQPAHFVQAKKKGADLFLASVAKSVSGTDRAYAYFPSLAQEYETPILMVNAVGHCDDFLSNGLSVVWDASGQRMGQLNSQQQGLILYDTEQRTTEIEQ